MEARGPAPGSGEAVRVGTGYVIEDGRAGRLAPGVATLQADPPRAASRPRCRTLVDVAPRIVTLALAALLTGLATLHWVLLPQLVRAALTRARERTGIDVRFTSAWGNLLTGQLALSEVLLRRDDRGRAYELKAEAVHLDAVVWGGTPEVVRLESVIVKGLRGRIERRRLPPEAPGSGGPDGRPRGRVPVHVARLELRDAQVEVRDPGPDGAGRHLAIRLDRAITRGYRSDWPLFDLAFGTELEGQVEGAPLRVTRVERDGRVEVRWRLEKLPLGALAVRATGPLSWMRGGAVTLDVRTRDARPEAELLELDWDLELFRMQARPPRRGAGVGAGVLARFLAKQASRLTMEVSTTARVRDFEGARSLRDAGLLEGLSDAVRENLVERARQATQDGFQSVFRARDRLARILAGEDDPDEP